ncbi:hypothetical protein GHT06_016458 [Daphnia sinensis]|uniref:Uncharacterized protein n=1 Tax=Daphnia sinensis TaxID=1820382 RepID=A0AAD5LFD0_9CRUS|nr:hypothetical protein GHT06_016458 [Daphnia sinensis]
MFARAICKVTMDASRLYNVSVESVGTTLEDVGDVWTQTCKSAEWKIQIPNLRNLRLLPRKKGRVKASRSAVVLRESKMFQNSSLQITHQVANKFRTTNVSATELKMLSVDVDAQFDDVERCPWNSSHVFECVPEPLEKIKDKTKQIAQLFYLMAAHFEELISFMKTVQNSAAIILGKLERANNVAVRRKTSRTNSKRKLKTAMQSLNKINTDLTRQLQQDRIQLETSSQQWQALKSRINYTQDEDWTNAKIKFELAKWRWSCSRQALNKTQEKLHNWSQLDEELSMSISESRQENVEIEREMLLLFNGTNNSIVQLERYRNLTEDFTKYYKGAGHFFLGISSRISDIMANIPKVGSDPAAIGNDLRKIKCDLDRNGRFVILTDGELLRKDVQRKIVGFVLGGAGKDCDVSV